MTPRRGKIIAQHKQNQHTDRTAPVKNGALLLWVGCAMRVKIRETDDLTIIWAFGLLGDPHVWANRETVQTALLSQTTCPDGAIPKKP
jgi:hypothetical protein